MHEHEVNTLIKQNEIKNSFLKLLFVLLFKLDLFNIVYLTTVYMNLQPCGSSSSMCMCVQTGSSSQRHGDQRLYDSLSLDSL